jgi:pimeloyl-ACP methyl ester carboxylesterase
MPLLMMRRRTGVALAGLGALALGGCRWLPRVAVVPMTVRRVPLSPQAQAPLLVVMLPGVYSLPRDFIDEGFVRTLHARGFAADVWLVDSHLGYVENGTLLERLHSDVIVPAQHLGYPRVWLVGISLGGFAALGLLRRQPDAVAGVLAIAPYVGRPELVQRVAAAGGAASYARAANPDDPEGSLWSWIGHAPAAQRDKIHLYSGSQDRFIEGQRLLAALLPRDHVLELPGDHNWPVWNALWQRWLARAPWPRSAQSVRTAPLREARSGIPACRRCG